MAKAASVNWGLWLILDILVGACGMILWQAFGYPWGIAIALLGFAGMCFAGYEYASREQELEDRIEDNAPLPPRPDA